MAGFHYRMQNILNIKLQLEEQKKMEFARAGAALYEEEQKLKKIVKRRNAYLREAEKLREKSLNVMQIRQNNTALDTLADEIKTQTKQVDIAREALETCRLQLQDAMQERKTQEKLYEHAKDDFIKEMNAKEGKEVDELTSYVYGQRGKMNKSNSEQSKQ